MKNSISLLACLILICSCAPVDEMYYHEFYAERHENINHLVVGERAPLDVEQISAISYFDYDPTYRFIAIYSEATDAKPFDMATYSGKTKAFIKKGTLKFKINGSASEIHVYQNLRYADHPVYGRYYFIPFKDNTNDELTYGGGRYMDMKKSLFNHRKVILDFNRAYNPWCAYADGYNCPIPPIENQLDLEILAGEKNFTKAEK